MKLLITFSLGVFTGAFLLWFGFSKSVVPLSGNLVMVDRFTGKATRVFVSTSDSALAEEKEFARMEELRKKPAAETKAVAQAKAQPSWRDLNEAEIKRLEFEWSIDKHTNGGAVVIKYHNPFEKEVRIEKVRIQIPAKNGRAVIDREYETGGNFCLPNADLEGLLHSLKIPTDDFYDLTVEEAPQSSGPDPFGTAPASGQKKARRLVGTVTPAHAVIQQ